MRSRIKNSGSRLTVTLVLTVVLACLGAGVALAAEPPVALVALLQNRGDNADERGLIDQLNATMIRNATERRYATSTFLMAGTGGVVQKAMLYRTILEMARAGYAVDVMVLGGNRAESISLMTGDITATDLVEALKPLRALRAGGLRFVYTTSGQRLAPIWRAAGAAAVLTYAGAVPPFFFPRFIKLWGEGNSVTRAAAKACAFSSALALSFSRFVDESTLAAHNGLLSPAPAFEGEDLNVAGVRENRAWELSPVQWPERATERAIFRHTALEEGLLKIFARLLFNDLEMKPELIPNMPALLDYFGNPVFTTVQGVFPGRDENEIMLPGSDVRVILAKFIPEIDNYMQELVDRLDSLQITRAKGRMLVDVWLTSTSRFALRSVKKAKTGQPYSVDLGRHLHFEISMARESITLGKVRGLTVQIKLPVVPDGVTVRKVRLDTSTEQITITAGAIHDLIGVVGKANVRARKFSGVDWLATIFKNAPLLLGFLFFGAF